MMLIANNIKHKIFLNSQEKLSNSVKIILLKLLEMALKLLQKICNIKYAIFKTIANLQYSIVQFLKVLQLQ